MFTIPNEGAAGAADQAEPDSADFDVIAAGFGGSGITSGCAVTAQGSPDMTVAVAVGGALVGGVKVNVAAGNVTITAADGTNPRFDLIVVDNAGAKSAVAGTAAANPVFPAIPASRTVLAAVHVPAADTTIAAAQITDKRLLLALPILVRKSADETVNNSAALQNDDHLLLAVEATSVYVVDLTLLVDAASATPDWIVDWTVPAGATMFWHTLSHNLAWLPLTAATSPAALLTESQSTTFGSRAGVHGALIKAIVRVGGTAGDLQFRWAQNTATATDSKVLTDSHMIARRIG